MQDIIIGLAFVAVCAVNLYIYIIFYDGCYTVFFIAVIKVILFFISVVCAI